MENLYRRIAAIGRKFHAERVVLFGLPIIATVLVQLNQSGDIHLFK